MLPVLGIGVQQDEEAGTLEIDQEQYLITILKKSCLADAKSVSTPADPNVKVSVSQQNHQSTSS